MGAVVKEAIFRVILCVFAAATLSACVTGQSTPQPQPAVARPLNLTNYNTLAAGAPDVGKDWSEAELRRQISGKTFLRNVPGKSNSVLYFSPNNVAYGWINKEDHIEVSTWTIQSRTPPGWEKARLFVCITLNNYDKQGKAIPNQVITDCTVGGIYYAAFVEHAEGDVFNIEGQKIPPFALPIERTTMAALKRSSGR